MIKHVVMQWFILSSLFCFSSSVSAQTKDVIPFLLAETEAIENIRDCALSPDGTELYFTHQDAAMSRSVVYQMIQKSGVWSKPVKAPFSGKYLDMEPAFSPDGLRLYFVSNRPKNKQKSEDFDIWYLERSAATTNWSDPIHPEATFNTSANEFYPSLTISGDLYFTSDRPGSKGKDDIFCAPFQHGRYGEVYSLSDSINTDGMEYNAWVAPSGQALIFGSYNRPDGFGSGDLYVSFVNPDGSWSKAANLGEPVNSDKMDYCPYVDLNRAVFYFTSRRAADNNVFSEDYLQEQQEFPGGRSRLFSIKLEAVGLLSEIR